MPCEELKRLVACSLCVMDSDYRRQKYNPHSCLPDADADIHVFVIEKESLVEAAQFFERLFPEEHVHARHTFWIERIFGAKLNMAPIVNAHDFFQDSADRRKIPGAVLCTPLVGDNFWGNHRGIAFDQTKDQLGNGFSGKRISGFRTQNKSPAQRANAAL